VPDEFPALETAAALGALAAAIRTYQLVHARHRVPAEADAMVEALRRGDVGSARELSERSEGAAFTSVAQALFDTLEGAAPRVERTALVVELKSAVREAVAAVKERVESGRARDLLVTLVLLGVVFFAARSGMAHPILYGLAGAGALLAASGFVLRPRLVERVEKASSRLLDAAVESLDKSRAFGGEPCPACGRVEAIVVSPAALGSAAEKLGLLDLRICQSCGFLQGAVEDPKRIPLGPEHGTTLSAERASIPGEEPGPPTEHEG
jgi:hypothetical protein